MGKCENMAYLKTAYDEKVHQSVKEAAERGIKEHLVFEKEGRDSRCFVASWAMGESHSVTEELRVFRDQQLMPSKWGRAFVICYYAASPWLIKGLKHIPGARAGSQKILIQLADYVRIRRK